MNESRRPEKGSVSVFARLKAKKTEESEIPHFSQEESIFEKKSFSGQYRFFRAGGLGILDSLFNTVYILLSERSVEKEKIKNKNNGEEEISRKSAMNLHAPHLQVISRICRLFRGLFHRRVSSSALSGKEKVRVRKKGRLFALLPAAIPVLLFMLGAWYVWGRLFSPIMVKAEINGEIFAIVENRTVVDNAIRELEQSTEVVLGKNFRFPYEITYSPCRENYSALAEKSKIYEELSSYVFDSVRTAAGVYVDDVLVAILPERAEVDACLEKFVEDHKTEALIGIYNEIRVVTQLYPSEAIITRERFRSLLEEMLKPLSERYPVSGEVPLPEAPSGEESGAIPDHVLITDKKTESETNISTSHYPQSVSGIKLSFYSAEVLTYEAEVPYKTVYQENHQYYTSMTDLVVQGKSGRANVTAKVYYIDGKETKREILSQTVLEQPVDSVITVGTKILPEDLGITSFSDPMGRFIVPRVGWVSSYFGAREGGYHYGWDIPGRRGDNLYAAASGTVLVAIGQDGYFNNNPGHSYSGYGYCVVIQHDDGYSTLYAHCNKICVTLGQKVKQGDKIAELGSTGDSTGNHVHFEIVLDNWRKLNPAVYLYKGSATIYDQK